MNNLLTYIAYITGTLFVAMGVAVLIADWVPDNFGHYKIIMAVTLFLYGAFRIVVTYTRVKQRKMEENKSDE